MWNERIKGTKRNVEVCNKIEEACFLLDMFVSRLYQSPQIFKLPIWFKNMHVHLANLCILYSGLFSQCQIFLSFHFFVRLHPCAVYALKNLTNGIMYRFGKLFCQSGHLYYLLQKIAKPGWNLLHFVEKVVGLVKPNPL